jgi:hypothetical protein
MKIKFIEATNHPEGFNWGKFMLARFEAEDWAYRSALVDDHRLLLAGRGWTDNHLMVTDIQTGEGAIFKPGGLAQADLQKHKIWVCPLFEPFLVWLYRQDLSDLDKLPAVVKLPDAPSAYSGYRREGK